MKSVLIALMAGNWAFALLDAWSGSWRGYAAASLSAVMLSLMLLLAVLMEEDK